MPLLIAVLAGLLIGLSLGALGGGGSILAVPVLVYLLDQSPVAATTASLLIVGISAAAGAVAAHRRGNVFLGRGFAFALVGTVGAALGATWSVLVNPDVLLVSFAALMLVVAVVMLARRGRPTADLHVHEPIIEISPHFSCDCPRALKVLVTGLVVGLLTGFLGVGGGFIVVPALVLALSLSLPQAVGTSLLVIAVNSAAAFVVRVGHGVHVDWVPVVVLTAMAVAGSLLGARVATRLPARTLSVGFAVLLLGVACYTAWQSLPALLA
jgi:hypothetical protein